MTGPWVHRIDAIPRRKALVDIKLLDGRTINACVEAATRNEQFRFRGIGDEVVYVTAVGRFLSNQIEFWRYA